MSWLDFMRRKAVDKESLAEYFSATVQSSGSFGSDGRRPSMSDLASRYGMLVHRCVTINAQTAAAIRPRLYAAGRSSQVLKANGLSPKPIDSMTKAMLEGRGPVQPSMSVRRKAARFTGDIVEIEQHPMLDLFDDVNPWTEGAAWRESLYSDLQIFGRHFSLLASDGGAPTEMWRLMPQKVEIESNKGAFVSGFKYGGGADAVLYSTEDVLWLNLFDPFDPLGGVSPLEAWLKTIDSQFANAAFVEYMFKKGGAPDFLLMAKQGMSTEQKRSFRAEFRRLFGRMVGRKDTIAILSGDAKLEPLQRPPRELQSVEHEKAMLDNIAIAFGVPKSLLTSDDVNLANAREGSVTHARNTIWPMVSRFEDVINQRLLPQWSDRLFVMHESPIKEDRQIRITERGSQIASGYTINEIREADGLPRFDEEWADAPMLSNSVSPAETIEEPEPAKPVTASSESQITKANESDDDPDAVVEVKFTDTMWLDDCVLGCSHEKATDDFGGEDEGSKAFTNALASVIREYLKQVIVSMKFCQHYVMKKPLVAGDDVLFFDAVDNEHIEELLLAAGDKHLSTVFYGAGSDALMTLESEYGVTVGAAFDIDTAAARKYLETTNRRIARDIPDSLQKEVRREIANGMRRGEDTTTVASKLQEMKGQWTDSRAKRIARTETRYAQEAGKMEGWGQSGVVAGKEFLIAPGACPVCKAVDMQVKGKMFPIGGKMFDKGDSIKYTDDGGKKQKFKFNYTSMKGPPVHPNCRCTLIPVIGED